MEEVMAESGSSFHHIEVANLTPSIEELDAGTRWPAA
jgi:hypothetical protein